MWHTAEYVDTVVERFLLPCDYGMGSGEVVGGGREATCESQDDVESARLGLQALTLPRRAYRRRRNVNIDIHFTSTLEHDMKSQVIVCISYLLCEHHHE